MGWKIWLEQRDAGVRAGQAGLEVLEQGRTPGRSMSRWKGAHCRQGCPCLWALIPASCQESLPCPEPPGVLSTALTPHSHTVQLYRNPLSWGAQGPAGSTHGSLRSIDIPKAYTFPPNTVPTPSACAQGTYHAAQGGRKGHLPFVPFLLSPREAPAVGSHQPELHPCAGSHLISTSREFRGNCWGDAHHTQGLSQVHPRETWRGWRGCQSSLSLVSSSSDLRE